MNRNDKSVLIDGMLRVALLGSVITVALFSPNSVKMFDKPLNKILQKLDKNSYERELKKALYYMKSQGLLKGDYDHGLSITDKGRQRINNADLDIDKIKINIPDKWDKKWRMLLYDIPENKKIARNRFARLLKNLDFIQLQRSVWVYPHHCEEAINKISVILGIDRCITYIECSHINNQNILVERFKAKNII